MTLTVKMANPRGFCAGVDRAIDIVYRALDVQAGREVALKLTLQEGDPVWLERFRREGQLTASLSRISRTVIEI